MIIPLGNDTRAEVILSVLGQLSDGIWENSSAMNKYWQFADVEGTDLVIDDEPFVYERDYSSRGYKTKSIRNGFSGMTEKQIRDWFANKAKQVVKIWAEDYGKDPKAVWDRNNLDEVTYMGHHRMDVTVADVYECYDFLKGRGGHKYGVSEEPAPVEVDEVVEPEVSGGMNPSQEEVEDFFLDASTSIRSDSNISSLDRLQKKIIDTLIAGRDTVTKERFSDIEICNMNDNYEANNEIVRIVSEYYTSPEICKDFLDALNDPDVDIITGGWQDSQGNRFPKTLYASTSIKCGTKYPKGYVKADTEATGVDYYLDRITDGISWALDVSTQTALDLIHAMQLDEDDLEDMGFSREEYPELFEG